MNITKFGHSCILVKENGVNILVDPGTFSTQQNELKNIDIVLITHNHGDHFDMASMKAIMQNNPHAKIITNTSVGTALSKEGISFSVVEDGQNITEKGVLIEGFGKDHALIHSSVPIAQNTGYFIANRFFYPGDAFVNPGKPVEILGLPTAAPWSKISEVIDYAIEMKAQKAFSMHDGILKNPKMMEGMLVKLLEMNGVSLMFLELEKEYEF